MRRSQIFPRALLERRVLPALAGRDCCDDLRRRGGTPGDLGSIRGAAAGAIFFSFFLFSALAVKQQQLIPAVFVGSVDKQANAESRQIIFFFFFLLLLNLLRLRRPSPSHPRPHPEGQRGLLKIPASSAGPRSHQQKVPLNGVLNQGLCLLPAAWSVGGSSLLEGFALLSPSASNGGNRRRGRWMFAAGWSSVYVALPPVYFCVVVLQPGRRRGGLMARRRRSRRRRHAI